MFESLELEIKKIKTNKFHILDGVATPTLRSAIEASKAPLPRAYKEFVLRFGKAKLYRKLGGYVIGVLASPEEEQSQDGERLFRIGHFQASNAYFKSALLHENEESPVFEGDEGTLLQVADGFEAWLSKRCKTARSKYNKRQWANVISGPIPFDPEELKVIQARAQFTCKVAGVTPQGKLLFEVCNGSEVTLPFLSIGVRKISENIHGGIWLPVSDVLPGQKSIVEHDVYGSTANPNEVEIFLLPDPEPEDRERYWEFKRV